MGLQRQLQSPSLCICFNLHAGNEECADVCRSISTDMGTGQKFYKFDVSQPVRSDLHDN